MLSCNIGTVFGFVIASYFDYYGQIKINIAFPILFLILINYFPETPEYLLRRNQRIVSMITSQHDYNLSSYLSHFHFQSAEKSRNFYRGIRAPPSLEMKRFNEPEKTYEKIEHDSTGLSLSDFCAYTICIVFIIKTTKCLKF